MYGCNIDITNNINEVNSSKHINNSFDKKIVHQIWFSSFDLPKKFKSNRQRCQSLNKDYEFKLWTKQTIENYVNTHHPGMKQLYYSYTYDIQRIDSIRYILLHDFGGIYMDMDISCERPFCELLSSIPERDKCNVLLFETKIIGITNSFMVVQQLNCTFFKYMMIRLHCTNYNFLIPYWTIMFSAGPTFVWRSYELYRRMWVMEGATICLLPRVNFDKFLTHHHSASWHSWDGSLMLIIEKYYLLIIISVICVIAYKYRNVYA
ncbi:hypothetical protein GJ496_000545 [Pomphorhynchus laevis]|nr:hypothetical protein GJ496_000545 [Pomphorhynchus laevis]